MITATMVPLSGKTSRQWRLNIELWDTGHMIQKYTGNVTSFCHENAHADKLTRSIHPRFWKFKCTCYKNGVHVHACTCIEYTQSILKYVPFKQDLSSKMV